MKLIIDIQYNGVEFENEEIGKLKLFIQNQLKDDDRQVGRGIKFKGSMFMISATYYYIEQNAKVVSIKQLTTHKPVIQKPKLVMGNA